MNGWIKLHRQLLSNPHVRDPDWLRVWIFILLSAAHPKEIRRVRWMKEVYQLHTGQMVTTKLEISEATGVDINKVHRVLNLMQSEQQIERQHSNKSSMITVLRWRHYQKVNNKMNNK